MSSISEREILPPSPVQLFDRLAVPAVVVGLEGLILEGNRAAAELYGLDACELTGQPLDSGALAGAAIGPWVIECVLARGSWQGEVRVQPHDRPAATLDARATPLPSMERHSASIVVAFLPGAGLGPARVEDDPGLREGQQPTVETSTWEWDPHEDRLIASELLSSTLGREPAAPMRMADALAAVVEEDRGRVQASIDRMLRGARDSFATVVRWHGHDGELRWLETRGEAVRDEDGNLLRVFGTTRLHLSGAEALAGSGPDDESWCAMLNSFKGQAVVLDERGVVVAVNESWRRSARQNGASSDYLGIDYLEVCAAAGEARADLAGEKLRELLSGKLDSFELEYACDGPTEQRWFVMQAFAYAGRGRRWAFVNHLDVTEPRRAAETAVLQAALLDELDAAVMATDMDHHIITWNAGAERLYGWSTADAVGRRADELMLAAGTSIDPAIGARLAGGQWDGECVARRKDGSMFPAYFRISTVRDEDGRESAVVWISMDISERRRSEHHLQLARDYLKAVIDSMGQGMFTLDAEGRVSYMNQAGQDLLGRSLEEMAGRNMHDVIHNRRPDGSPLPSEECPILQAHRQGEVVRVEQDIFVRADGSEMAVAYTAAPFASGDGVEGCVVVFEDISERQAQAREIERDLEKLTAIKRIRNALDQGGFLLYAQPIIELASGSSVQRELLIRMRHPEQDEVLSPAYFLPAAEEYGFIDEIDRWVIDRSAELAARGLPVELNISAISIGDPGLIDHIAAAIERTGADPTKIVFEITETALVSDEEVGRRFVTALHQLGCKVALDDFGTGYGGFTYLKQLPIDYLKVDIEFVRDLRQSGASRKVVEAIVNLARGFDLQTVAEGVEDEETLVLLRELGVDYAQGYHIGRPAELQLPAETADR